MKKLLFLVVIIFAIGAIGLWSQLRPIDDQAMEVVFEVAPGPFIAIANQLKEKGLIRNAKVFSVFARLQNKTKSVRIGEYLLNTSMDANEILKALSTGKSITYPVTFQEGLNMFEVADILAERGFVDKERFLSLCRDQNFIVELLNEKLPSLEGYLFPETYMLTKFTTEKEVIRAMVRNFKEATAGLPKNFIQNKSFRHKIVTLASIIEKETGAPGERKIISSVFYNRLKKNMRLQSDPTIIYGARVDLGKDLFDIKKSDINQKTRYNTYTINGLPFGPIANPGKASLEAALNPDKTDYFYFVSENDGTHYFSKTYKEHQKAVRKFQLNHKARQGKSWRDLNKNNN